LVAAVEQSKLDAAASDLANAVAVGQVEAASLYFRQGSDVFARAFGKAKSPDDIFLLASISKPMSVTALMSLFDRGEFRLGDPVTKFIPEFTTGSRSKITIRQLLTHSSGLPDQLPENEVLRKRHAPLSEFVQSAVQTPLLFAPGSKYSYSSMGILLATEVAYRITGIEFLAFMNEVLFEPLEMKNSALGLGRFKLEETMRCQITSAAPESGGGDSTAKEWDWNSHYWRSLGAPWGGVHGSATDVGKFFGEFLYPTGSLLNRETAQLMVRNHNPIGRTPRGLGFGVSKEVGSPGCSDKTFGHTGSTGTLAWADPPADAICVVLTTLPAQAADPHPRKQVSDGIVRAITLS
jgi:CubicO group peptidase (beta-lactamase class C family)